MDPTERPGRPWAAGIGLLLLGLAVSAIANGVSLSGGGTVLRVLGTAGYVLGVLVAGAGIHRILWVGPQRRSRAARVLVTAVVTIPTFVVAALFFSLLFTILQIRFSS
jgi:hypothetical protein